MTNNWAHFQTFVWLRWRLMRNQWARAGKFSAVLSIIMAVSVVGVAVPSLIGCFALGVYLIPMASPEHLMYAWDAILILFLFFWGIGLLTDLQKADSLSLSKFLHLPVSVSGAFLINYLSSLVRLSLVLFVPVMLGFAFALIYVKGLAQLPTLLLLAAFLLMVTALTYQFQGWLASLMSNPRLRRTVVVGISAGFILITQLPNMFNAFGRSSFEEDPAQIKAQAEARAQLTRDFQAGQFDAGELNRRTEELEKTHQAARARVREEILRRWNGWALIANGVFPAGWLPMGVMAEAEGKVLPPLLGLLGMTAIGSGSLWLAYRATIRQYQGESSNRVGRVAAPRLESRPDDSKLRTMLIEARLPGLSEPVSAVALAGIRGLLRAPEAKMAMLMPVIMVPFLGSFLFKGRNDLPEILRPLVVIGGLGFMLLSVLQLGANQFGYDRDGFRFFVLCSARRRDILLGKNLALAPVGLVLGLALIVAVQILCPMRIDHFLAMFPQLISMFLMLCVLTNLMSICTPIHLPSGSLKPPTIKASTALLQMLMMLGLFPLIQSLTLLPIGIEALMKFLGWIDAAPVALLLTALECVGFFFLYLLILEWEGRLFQSRELRILEIVSNRAA